MWFKVFLTGLWLMGTGFIIGKQGQEREPYSPGDILLSLMLDAFLIYGLWKWA